MIPVLYHRRYLLAKYDRIIDQVEYSKLPFKSVSFTHVALDPCKQGIVDKLRVSHNKFIDDSLSVATTSIIKHIMVARIETLYIVFGFPDLTARQDPLNLDKYSQSVYSYERV